MTIKRDDIARVINRLAAIIALLVALCLPLGYALIAYRDLSAELTFKARIKASALNGLIATAPELWVYAENRMLGLIAREPVLLEDEAIAVRDARGTLVAQSGTRPPPPLLLRSYPLLDGTRVVGRIDVSATLRDRLRVGAFVAALGALLGVLVYAVMQIVPLRALRRVTDALIEEKEQGEALLDALRRREQALQQSEESLSITLNSIGDAVIATDTDGRVTRLNPAAERLTGWPFAEARGRPLDDVLQLFHAGTRAGVANPVRRVIEGGEVVGLDPHTVLRARDGKECRIADSAAPIRDARGDIVGVVLVFSDVSENYRTRETLHETQAILRAAMDQTPAGIAIADAPDGAIRYINDAGLAIRGQDRSSPVLGLGIREHFSGLKLLDADGRALDAHEIPLARAILFGESGSREFAILRADGSERVVVSRAAPIRDTQGEVVAAIAVFLDVTESKVAEDEIKRLAFYDQLTGLPNRRLLLDRLAQALAARSRRGNGGALLFIDLDDFRTINDTLGHDFGDALLKQVATRLTDCMRAGDTVARLGGDEFVVLLDGLGARADDAATQAETAGRKILACLAERYPIASHICQSTASIGVALLEHSISVDELMKRADLAMYQAKAAGRNTLRFFDPRMQARVRARAALEGDLREAIRSEQFLLLYQAQVDADGSVFGAETLLRWQRANGTLVSPGDFIALAEETGQILAIGQWVLETVCRQLATWAKRPALATLEVAVNVSARQFHHPDFVAQVVAALQTSGANPQRLKLELTESLLVDDLDGVIAKMSALKASGVSFALDDFGTGYSSLAYLKRLPLDQLKIDQSFVRDLLSDANDTAIVRTIVALGQSLGLSVIAEGVENAAQRDCLEQLGCRYYQGYHFGRPLPVGRFERLARDDGDGAGDPAPPAATKVALTHDD